MVVLKRLSHAVAEGDRVYAVIKGSAVGHDGRTTSVTAPSPLAQVRDLASGYRLDSIVGCLCLTPCQSPLTRPIHELCRSV